MGPSKGNELIKKLEKEEIKKDELTIVEDGVEVLDVKAIETK